MKNLIPLFCLLLVFTACSKSNNDQVTPKSNIYSLATSKSLATSESLSISTKLVDEVLSLPKSKVALGYSTLGNSEKVLFWKKHIDQYLETHEVSEDIKSHILKFKGLITVDFYNSLGTQKGTEAAGQLENGWFSTTNKATTSITKILLEVGTLAGVGKDESAPVKAQSITPLASVTCDCSYNVYCSLVGGTNCYAGIHCNEVDYNCGVFGGSKCTGTCLLVAN